MRPPQRIPWPRLLAAIFCLVPWNGFAAGSKDAPTTTTLELTFVDIEPDQGGNLVASLFRGEEGWLKPEGVFRKVTGTVDGESLTLRIEDVPFAESYAVQVFHDANGNGKLDFRRVIPIPKEGVGVSNNHQRMGPPLYKKAEFAIERSELKLRIQLRYF